MSAAYSWAENPTTYGHGNQIWQGVICSGLQQFFVYLRFVTTRQNDFLLVGWGHFFSMSPQDKIIFLWWGGSNFFIWNFSRQDKIIFSWWVELTKSSLFNYIWVSLHHEKIILSCRDMEGGHFIFFEMAITREPWVGFWFFQGQNCLKLNFWLKFWQFDHETTRTTWWFWWNWRVLELCRSDVFTVYYVYQGQSCKSSMISH